ncbi:hypothetical protein JXA47_11165 [Candidatus Sumerlaeota bacterium]|nr:hypothetical protein [Candidatus Sumerlaeota bacterium]
MSRRVALALAAAIVALHLAVRIPLLGLPIWVDEPVGVLCATQPPREAWRITHDTYSPPLHPLMMSLWGEALRLLGWRSTLPREGVEWSARFADRSFVVTIPIEGEEPHRGTLGASELERWQIPPLWLLRLPTLLMSMITLVGAMAFTRWVTASAGMALCVGAMLALSPAVARWDATVRYYSILGPPTLGAAAALWGIASCASLRARWWLLPALSLAVALVLLTHHIGAFSLPFLGLWLMFVCGRIHWRRTLAGGLAMLAGLALFLLIWGPSLREQWTGSGLIAPGGAPQRDWLNSFPLQPALPQRVLLGLDGQTGTWDLFPPWWIWTLITALLIATLGYVLRLVQRRATRLDALLLLWLFGAPAFAVLLNTLKPNTGGWAWRQYTSAAPAAALLFTLGFEALRRWGRSGSGEEPPVELKRA